MTPRRVSEKTVIICWLPAVVKALDSHSALPTLRLLILLQWIKRIVHPKLLFHPFTHRHRPKQLLGLGNVTRASIHKQNFTQSTPTAATDFHEKQKA